MHWVKNLAIYPSKSSPNRSLELIFKMENIRVYVLIFLPHYTGDYLRWFFFINRKNRWWMPKPQWLYTANIKIIGRKQVGRPHRYENLSANGRRKFLRRMTCWRVKMKGSVFRRWKERSKFVLVPMWRTISAFSHSGSHCHPVQIDMYDWISLLSSTLNISPMTYTRTKHLANHSWTGKTSKLHRQMLISHEHHSEPTLTA